MEIENHWRKAHEARSAIAWAVAGMVELFTAPFLAVPAAPMLITSLISFWLSAYRARSVYLLWETQANLQGRNIEWMEPGKLLALPGIQPVADRYGGQPGMLFLGRGFDWQQKHVQRLHALKKLDISVIMPPQWYMTLRQRWSPSDTGLNIRGVEWIHGLEPKETDIYAPLKDMQGNTVIFGTTGSGKTRCFEIIATQAIHRENSILIVIDPKGDRALRERLQLECARVGKEFMFFHPAFPSLSVRLDPLKNWQRVTELASRVASLIRGESGDSVFKDFAWRAINQIAAALVELEERPNLLKLRRYLEGGPEHLLQQTLEDYFRKHVPDWAIRIDPYMKKANKGDYNKERPSKNTSSELMAYVRFYKAEIPESQRSESADALVSMFEHNRDHQMKLIQSLLPLLTQLTSGELGALLSPDGSDADDIRPILDTKKIIDSRQVLYVGLDALSDSSVAAAIGAIILADLASVAGHRYNYGGEDIEINLLVDEAAEVITPPFVQILNKARGAGFVTYFAAQSYPDFVARTGNADMAKMIIANANNLIALRTIDDETQKYIVGNFGKTSVVTVAHSQSTSMSTDGNPTHYSGGYSERLSETEVDIYPADMLGKLPDLHFIANISGGRIIKGRLPLLTKERTPTLEEMSWLQV